MELNALVGGRAHALHEKLPGANDVLAGVTLFTTSRATPDAWDVVVRKPAIGELAANDETERVLVHMEGPGSYLRRLHRPACFMSRDLPLRVPDLEAPHVKLHTEAAGGGADALDDELSPGDDLLAGVTGLAVPRSAPHPRDAVLRQATVRELASDEDTECVVFHGGPVVLSGEPRQIHWGLCAEGANLKGRREGEADGAAGATLDPLGSLTGGQEPARRQPRQREYPQPPPPSSNSTTRTINTVSMDMAHHLPRCSRCSL